MTPSPHVSVIIRSYNRHRALCQLLHAVLDQDFQDFEVVVVEQSTRHDPAAADELAALERNPRIRLLRHPPLGGPRARNIGARAARGEILVLMDDDDLPGDNGWLTAHLANFADPDCVAVTGRWISDKPTPPMSPRALATARRNVLSYVPVLMYQRVYAQADRRRLVHGVHGGNVSIRRDALVRFGLWDECTSVEDELSLCYRYLARRRPNEHAIFDPQAVMIRRVDIPGGMDKRYQGVLRYGWRHFEFLHNIIGHYFPIRFVLLYPVYAVMLWVLMIDSLWGSLPMQSFAGVRRVATTVGVTLGFPLLWLQWLARLLVKRVREGAPVHDPQLAADLPEPARA
jgi:glycosyltransferase involved in cell wall biosynthesis